MFKKKTKEEKMIEKSTKANKKKMPTMVKALIIIGGALIITVGAIFLTDSLGLGGNTAERGPLVTAGTIERMDLQNIVSIKGTIEGSDSADVFSTASYRISSITVEEGDKVTKGQILATLDAEDLENQYSVAKIETNDAKKAYETAASLYNEGAISKSEYDAAKSTYETAKYRLSSYNLSEQANITSPIDGTITRVNCTVGRIANEGTNNGPMFVIEDIDNLQMKVQISEYDISEIKLGQEVEISAEVLGKQTVKGTVSKISPTGEIKEGGNGEMIIPVVIDVDKGDTNLIAGVTAKAKILTDSRENVLTAPIDAIFEDPETEELSIFFINEGILSKKNVEVGLEGDFYVELLGEQIEEGAQVLLAPTFEHYDGMAVTVI